MVQAVLAILYQEAVSIKQPRKSHQLMPQSAAVRLFKAQVLTQYTEHKNERIQN
jgi:hypothetical protein